MKFKDKISRVGLTLQLLTQLNEAELIYGHEFIITSAVRKTGVHALGMAVDVRCWGSTQRWKMREAFEKAGFRRIGIYDKHIHVDMDSLRPQGLWGGKSS